MTSRRTLLAALLALAAVFATLPAASLLSPAVAQDDGGGDGDGDGEKEKEKEKTPEEKELIQLGKEFKAKDSAALLRRLPEKRKVRLILGRNDDRYYREQARQVLDDWFESRSITKVKLKKTSGSVGEFQLKLRRKEKEAEHELILVIRIAKEDDQFVLKSIEVSRE